MDFETLSSWADEELKSLVKILPADVQEAANKVVISFEEQPGQGSDDEGLEGDELGLFEGPCALDEDGSGETPRIRLFLMNLCIDFCNGLAFDFTFFNQDLDRLTKMCGERISQASNRCL